MARALSALAAAQRALIPPLTFAAHKGQHGRIAVLGGSYEYCGAPFYAASSALKCGADIVHIFCTREAAIPIKSFSPELIVHPVLRTSGGKEDPVASIDEVVHDIEEWLPRLHALVVGPGLGRDASVLSAAMKAASSAAARNMPVVLDADALWAVAQDPTCFPFSQWTVVTPNIVEFRRLCAAVGVDATQADCVAQLSARLNSATVVLKGKVDTISNASADPLVSQPSECPRRCGGQGDILAGTTGVFLAWAHMHASRTPAPASAPAAPAARADAGSAAGGGTNADAGSSTGAGVGAGAGADAGAGAGAGGGTAPAADETAGHGGGVTTAKGDGSSSSVAEVHMQAVAAYCASALTRRCATMAFTAHRRGMTTPDMLALLPQAFEAEFPFSVPQL